MFNATGTDSFYNCLGRYWTFFIYFVGYEDLQQLASQDYGKSNYGLSTSNQTKTVSSGASGMALGVNDGNKAYAGGLKVRADLFCWICP